MEHCSIYQTASIGFRLARAATAKMRFTLSGRVGIGTTSAATICQEITVLTTADGCTSPTERDEVDSSGNTAINQRTSYRTMATSQRQDKAMLVSGSI
jgi:hypothetical protein